MAGPNGRINQVRRKGIYSTKRGNGDNLLLMKRQGKHGIQEAESDELSNHETSSPMKKRAKAEDVIADRTRVVEGMSMATI